MFKKLETSWNSHTPVWLHNGTKENIIFQLTTAVIVCGAMMAYHEWKDYRDFKRWHDSTED